MGEKEIKYDCFDNQKTEKRMFDYTDIKGEEAYLKIEHLGRTLLCKVNPAMIPRVSVYERVLYTDDQATHKKELINVSMDFELIDIERSEKINDKH